MLRLSLLLFVSAFTHAHAEDIAPVELRKIEYLIASIETLQNAQFIRNDTAYDAGMAANHLRQKLKIAGSRVRTADDFIRLCATRSSVSGVPYQIRFSDGRQVSSEAFLKEKLREYDTYHQ